MNNLRYSKKKLKDLPSDFNYDEEGLWSLTFPDDADKISNILINELGNNTILDGTAGLGGNLLSFTKYFRLVIGIESNTERFKLLKNNIKKIKVQNIELFNNNSIQLIFEKNITNNIDYYFFDPPWGGPDYKKHNIIKLKLDNYELKEIIKLIDKPKIFKLPKNYDLCEFSEFNYKIYTIKSYLLLIFYN